MVRGLIGELNMGFGFNIRHSNADVMNFGMFMEAALLNPTYQGNLDVVNMNIPLTAYLNSADSVQPYVMKGIDPYDINFSYTSDPYSYALANYAALTDPTYFSDGILSNYNIGLSSYLNASYNASLDSLYTNPFGTAFRNGMINFDFNPDEILSNIDAIIKKSGGGVSDKGVDYTDNTDKGQFNRTVELIKAYGEKKDISYDEKISKITTDMKGDYKKGLVKLKELINDFDADTLYDVVKDMHHKQFEAKEANGRAISDRWANKIANNTDGDFTVDTSGLTADNVLHVLGTYIQNEKFQSGGMWTHLIKDNFDKISEALYAKAEKSKQVNSMTDADKQKIEKAVADLKKATSVQDKADKAYALFDALRSWDTTHNDTHVYNIYGSAIPANKRKERVELYETKQHRKEQEAYNNAPKSQFKG